MVASTMAIGGVSASAATLKAPKTVTAKNAAKGVKVTWSKVKGAKKYKVYRANKAIKTVKKTTFTDTTAKAGKTYSYKVKAVGGKASKAVKVTFLKAPKLTISTPNSAKGASITISKVKGATKYVVYKKAEGAKSFTKLGTTTKSGVYVDKKSVSGVKSQYKVKAYAKSTKSYSVFSNVYGRNFVAQPQNLKVTCNKWDTEAVLTWDAVDGAKTYKVYRQAAGEDEATLIAKDLTEATYTDKYTDVNANAYKYTVKAKDTANSVESDAAVAQYIPKDSYFTDAEGNLNVNVKLAAGDVYKNGEVLVKELGVEAKSIEVVEGDAVTVSGNTVTAAKAGDAKVKVTLDAAVAQAIRAAINGDFANQLATGVVYVNFTVA